MDALTFRTAVVTLLDSYVGTYTLANGVDVPAVGMRAPGEPRPSGTLVDGLEVIIEKDPQLLPVTQYSNIPAISQWTVYLVDWGTAPTQVTDAAKVLIAAFPGANYSLISVPQGVGPQNQARVTLQTNPDQVTAGNLTIVPSPFLYSKTGSILAPAADDQFTLLQASRQMVISDVVAVVRGPSTPSVTFELRYGTDRSASGTLATVSEAIGDTTDGEPVTVQNMPIPAGAYLWCVITAVAGTVDEFSLTIKA